MFEFALMSTSVLKFYQFNLFPLTGMCEFWCDYTSIGINGISLL